MPSSACKKKSLRDWRLVRNSVPRGRRASAVRRNSRCRCRCPERSFSLCVFFFFNDTATTEIYTLSLHDALPIPPGELGPGLVAGDIGGEHGTPRGAERLAF